MQRLLVMIGTVAVACCAGAAPFGKWFTHRVPSTGAIQRIYGVGDEYQAMFKDEEGNALSYNPQTGCYEKSDEQTRQSRMEKVRERMREYLQSTGRTERWRARKASRLSLGSTTATRSAAYQSAAANENYQATSGTIVGVTLLVDFPLIDEDGRQTNTLAAVAHPNVSAGDLEEMINGSKFTKYGNVSSCRAYYETVSGGALIYTNVVIGWIQAPHPRDYYDKPSVENGQCGRQLIGDVLQVLAARDDYTTEILPRLQKASYHEQKKLVVMSDYLIRALNVYFAGEESTTWGYGLWAHQSTLQSDQYKAAQITIDGHTCHFSTYQLTPVTSNPSILTFCHENGHMVCDFPDLYHYNSLPGNGVGMWDLMCGRTGTYDTHPQYLSAYLRVAMGWVQPKPLPVGGWVTVTDALSDVYYFANPQNAKEYYLIENRQARGYDQEIRSSGIAIYRCNEDGDNMYPTVLSDSLKKVFANYGAATNRLNYEVSLEQADGLYSLETAKTNGDSGDAWKADNPAKTYGGVFNGTSVPCARWADGTAATLNLSHFSPNGRTMSFWSAAPASSATSSAASRFNLALDCDDVKFWTKANRSWSVDEDESRDGKSAARSADIAKGETSWFYCSFSGKGTFYFDWKVDGADTSDRLSFFTSTNEGVTASTTIKGPNVAWARKGYTFKTDGAHCVHWRYYNQSGKTTAANAGWLDRIRWVPTTWKGEPIFGTACSYSKQSGVLTMLASMQEYGSNTVTRTKATSATAQIEVADNSAFSNSRLFDAVAINTATVATITAVPVFESGRKCYARLVVTNNGKLKKNGRAYTFTAVTPTLADVAVKPKMEAWHTASEESVETFEVQVESSGVRDESVNMVAEFSKTADFATVIQSVSTVPSIVPTGRVTSVSVRGFPKHEAVYLRLRAVNSSGLSSLAAQTVRHDYALDVTDFDRWLKAKGFTTRDYARSSEIAAMKSRATRFAKCRADGRVMSVFDEYVAGTNPDDEASVFRTSIQMGANGPELTWMPDLGDERVYTVYGKANLSDEWSSRVDETHRFFKVSVSLPEGLDASIEDRAGAISSVEADAGDEQPSGDVPAINSGFSTLSVPPTLQLRETEEASGKVAVSATNDLVQTVHVNVEKVNGRKRITSFVVNLKGTVWLDLAVEKGSLSVSNVSLSSVRNFSEAPFLCWAGPRVDIDAAVSGSVAMRVPIAVDATLSYKNRTLTHDGKVSIQDFDAHDDMKVSDIGLDATVFAGVEVGAAVGAETSAASAKFMKVTVVPGVTGTFKKGDADFSGTIVPTVSFSFAPLSLELFDRTFEPVELTRTIVGTSLPFAVLLP